MNTHQRVSRHRRTLQKRAVLTRAERLCLWCMLGLCMLAFFMVRPGPVDVFQWTFWLRLWEACSALLGPRVLGLCALILCMLLLITLIGAIQFCRAQMKPRKVKARAFRNSRDL